MEARVLEEATGQDQPAEELKKLPIDFIIAYLNANRLGDAILYTSLHRGKFVFVKLWNRFFPLSGLTIGVYLFGSGSEEFLLFFGKNQAIKFGVFSMVY